MSRADEAMVAIEAVYRERFASFVRLAWAITRNEQQAYDAVHDAFVRAVRHRRALRGHESAGAWIARIVLNEARRRAGGNTGRSTADMDELVSLNNDRDGGALETAISELPGRQRLVLFLHYYADLDYGEIASVLGISSGTVGATLNAGRTNLRNALEGVERWTM